jgi:hypothetical protein
MSAETRPHSSARTLWFCVAVAFALLFAAWITLFNLAARHRVPEVPIALKPLERR